MLVQQPARSHHDPRMRGHRRREKNEIGDLGPDSIGVWMIHWTIQRTIHRIIQRKGYLVLDERVPFTSKIPSQTLFNSKGPFGFPIMGGGGKVGTAPFSQWAFRWMLQWIIQTPIESGPWLLLFNWLSQECMTHFDSRNGIKYSSGARYYNCNLPVHYVPSKMALSHLRTAYYKGRGQESEWTKGALLTLGVCIVCSVSGVHASLNSVDLVRASL